MTRFNVKVYRSYLLINLELRDTIAISLSNIDGIGHSWVGATATVFNGRLLGQVGGGIDVLKN